MRSSGGCHGSPAESATSTRGLAEGQAEDLVEERDRESGLVEVKDLAWDRVWDLAEDRVEDRGLA